MSQPSPPAQPKPKRNPVERAIVWGVIVIGLLAVGREALPWWQHKSVLDALTEKLKKAEESDVSLKKSDIVALLGGKQPDRTEPLSGRNIGNGAQTVEVYSWFTLNPSRPRELYVYYGHVGKQEKTGDPEVIEIGSIPAKTAEELFKEQPAESPKPTMPVGAMDIAVPPAMRDAVRANMPGSGAVAGSEQPASGGAESKGDQTPADKPADDAPSDESDDKKPE